MIVNDIPQAIREGKPHRGPWEAYSCACILISDVYVYIAYREPNTGQLTLTFPTSIPLPTFTDDAAGTPPVM